MSGNVFSEHGFFHGMSWFGAFRNHYRFTWYGENRTTVTVDVPLVVVTYICIVIAVATLIAALGVRGRERWSTTLRASYAVGLGSVLLACIFGHNWLQGNTEVTTKYIYRTNHYFQGSVGLRVALHGTNVTLEGFYGNKGGGGYVYYAEALKWSDYGREPEQINHYLERGLPHPLLTVVEFMSVDEGGLRWGRQFHTAGYFAGALLWTAFCFWIVANVLLLNVVSYGGFMVFLTGVAMVLACIVYHVCQPPHDLRIHFGDALLTVQYGWCFWLTLVFGLLTTILGAALFVMDHMFHETLAEFFNLEDLCEDDNYDLPLKSIPQKGQEDGLQNGSHLSNSSASLVASQRRGSLQQISPRRGSIFLEPERRSSDYTSALRRPSLLSPFSNGLELGVHGRSFEALQRAKCNPLFAFPHNGIKEETEDPERPADVTIEMDRCDANICRATDFGGTNRKPSLATMREHRENHINNERQQQAACRTSSASSLSSATTSSNNNNDDDNVDERPSSVLIHPQCPTRDLPPSPPGSGKDAESPHVGVTVGEGGSLTAAIQTSPESGRRAERSCLSYSDDSPLFSASSSPDSPRSLSSGFCQ